MGFPARGNAADAAGDGVKVLEDAPRLEKKNFYYELISSYGYAAEAERIQDLYLDGRKQEAVAAVPDELVRAVSLIGSASEVAERVAAFASSGVTTLTVTPLARSSAERVALMSGFRALVG